MFHVIYINRSTRPHYLSQHTVPRKQQRVEQMKPKKGVLLICQQWVRNSKLYFLSFFFVLEFGSRDAQCISIYEYVCIDILTLVYQLHN